MGDPHPILDGVIDEEAISPLRWRWLFNFFVDDYVEDGDVDSDVESVLCSFISGSGNWMILLIIVLYQNIELFN